MAEKRTIELEIQDNSKTLKQQYRDAVKELQNVAAAYGETSAEAVKAAQKAAELKDQIAFTNDLVGAFNPDAKFNSLSKSIGGVLDGFQAVQGGLGLIGIEGEAVEEAMVRVQSAMALSQGLQGLMEARDSFKQLGTVAMNALKGIRTGLAATGIGVFIVALGTVVAYWEDIKALVSGVSEETEKSLVNQKKRVELAQTELDVFDLQTNSLRLQGKSEEEILKLRQYRLKQIYKEQEAEIEKEELKKKLEVAAAKRNKMLLEGYLTFQIEAVLIPFRLLAKSVDSAIFTINQGLKLLGKAPLDIKYMNEYLTDFRKFAAEGIASKVFDPEEVAAKSDKVISELKNNLIKTKSEIDGAQIQINNITKNNNDKNLNNAKDNAKEIIDLEKQIQDEKLKLVEDENAKAQMMAIAAAEERIKEVEKTTADEKQKAELIKLIRENLNNELNALDEEYYTKQNAAKAEADKLRIEQENAYLEQIEQIQELNFQNSLTEQQKELQAVNDKYFALETAAQGNAEQMAIIEEAKNAEIDKINATYEQKEAERRKKNRDFAIEMALSSLSTISNLTELFGKKNEKAAKRAFQVNKAAQLASAVISTYQSATSAYASQFVPPDPTSPVRGAIAAGVAVAAGLANVAKIASQKFESGGSSGGGGGSSAGSGGGGAQMAAPQFNTIGTSGINQLATLQQQPTKAYVVSGEVTSAQSLDRNRLQNATL